MHSSYHVQTNMSVNMELFEKVYKGRYYSLLVCTSIKVIEAFKVDLDVQEGVLQFRENLMINVLVSSNSLLYL